MLGALGPERLSQFLREEHWLFERGEMSALVELVPIEQVRPQGLGPCLRRAEYFVREHRRSHWQFDPPCRKARQSGAHGLPVDTSRRCGGIRETVEAYGIGHGVQLWGLLRDSAVFRPCPQTLVSPPH